MFFLCAFILLLIAINYLVDYQADSLSEEEVRSFKKTLLETKKRELENYTMLAKTAIQPILNNPQLDHKKALKQIRELLDNLKYGTGDGYFFIYDQQGICLAHPIKKDFVGKNKYKYQDKNGDFVIQSLLKIINNDKGSGFHTYYWHRPSTGEDKEKISYVIKLEPFGWLLGTGLYMEDINRSVNRLEKQMKNNIRSNIYLLLMLTILIALMLVFLVYWQQNNKARLLLNKAAHQFVKLQVSERRHFAKMLHDEISPDIVVAKNYIELFSGQINKKNEYNLDQLDKSREILNQTVSNLRKISHGLRPILLDDMGLKISLRNLLNQFEQTNNISCEFIYEIDDTPLAEEIETTLYRVSQEALTNIKKHAKASQVSLKLSRKSTWVVLKIQDNGQGFSCKHTHNQAGIGLKNMQDRIKLLSGSFYLDSSKIKGTIIKIALKINKEKN